jgi:hypothetical protein
LKDLIVQIGAEGALIDERTGTNRRLARIEPAALVGIIDEAIHISLRPLLEGMSQKLLGP